MDQSIRGKAARNQRFAVGCVTLGFEGATSSCGYCQPSAHHPFLGSYNSPKPEGSSLPASKPRSVFPRERDMPGEMAGGVSTGPAT